MSPDAPRNTRNLSSILLEAAVVTPEQVEAGLDHQRKVGVRFGEALVQLGVATESDIGWALSRQLGIPFIDLFPETLDRDLIRGFEEATLRRLLALPLVRDDESISVAFADPIDLDAIVELETIAGMPVNPSIATPSSILAMLNRLWRHRTEAVHVAPVGMHALRTRESDRSGSLLLTSHLARAIAAGASEIHFLPGGGATSVQHRVEGRLVHVTREPQSVIDELFVRLEALGGPTFDGEDLHAAGRVVCPMGDREQELDVSLLGCEEGLAIRIGLQARASAPTLEDLGLDPLDLARLRDVVDQPAGLVLVSGPPRSGCSTTLRGLAAAASRVSRLAVAFEGRGGMSFVAGVHARLDTARARARWADIVVAHNADVVVLDGVLAGEFVAGVLASAASGRLLLATTDWSDTFALLDYLLGLPSGPTTLGDQLLAVIEQRMIGPESNGSGMTAASRPVFEVLFVTDELRERMRSGASIADLRALAAAGGYRRLADRVRPAVDDGTPRTPIGRVAGGGS